MNRQLYELTEPQKNILQIEQFNSKNSNLYTLYTYLKFSPKVDCNLLEKVINKIYELNDSVRICLCKDEKSNNYFQYFENYEYKKIEIIESQTDSILEIIDSKKSENFSVNGELNKFYIVKLPSHTYILYITHHIISDGYGLTNIVNQIKEIYTALSGNDELNNLEISSYKNFISREQEYLNSSRFGKDKLYWENQVKNIEPCTIFKDKNLNSTTAKRYEKIINKNLWNKIQVYCTKNKITEYSFFLAAIYTYYNNIYNLNNLTIGTAFLNRQKRNNEFNDVGLHVCTLPLNITTNSNLNFIELCNLINSENLGLYKHGNFPFIEIKKLYNNTNNLFEIGFSYQIGLFENEKNNKDVKDCKWVFSGAQNNAITFHIIQFNSQKMFAIDYLTSLFSEKEIEKINSIIFSIINQTINNNMFLNNYNLLLPEDYKLLNKFNNSGNIEKLEKTVVDYFEEIVKKHPNKTALICNNKKMTYFELSNKINYLANYLSNNISKNSPVILLLDKSFEMIISIFAALKVGCYYVPILPDENINRIKYIIEDCKPACILTHKNHEKIIKNDTIINLDKLTEFNTTKNTTIKTNSNSIVYTIYTSGSTGNPKGVQITNENIIGFIESIKNNKYLKPHLSDVSMSLLKYSFDASGIDIYSSLLTGGTLLLVDKKDELNPIKVLELIEKYKVTRSFLIPKWIEHIVSTSLNYNYNLSSLKLLGTGGEILKPNLLSDFIKKYPKIKIANLYGPSETTMFTTQKIITKNEIENNYASIGSPIPYSRIAIINKNNNFLPINSEGELIVYEDDNSINNIAKGYLNLHDQTKNKFINIFNPLINKTVRAYKTGDIAKINNNLELDFVGRTDDIVKINGGYLVALNEIEKITNNLLDSMESYAVTVPYRNTNALVIFVHQKNEEFTINNINNYLKNNLPFYMQPKKIILINDIPSTSSGKIDKQTLKNIAINELNKQNNSLIKPSTSVEKEIFEIIKNILNIEDFSTTDDFLDDLGIDSLALTTINVALKKYNLNMQDLYTNSTVFDLAQFIEDKNKTKNLLEETDNIEKIHIKNNSKKFDISTILLTGVTGFLGIHILKELLFNNSVQKIYCIIRNKIGIDAKDRLDNLVDYYYNSDRNIKELISKKVIVLVGDISEPYLGLEKDVYSMLQKEVTTVINSAANVKHYEKPEQIKKDNVISCDNIIEFCGNNISLAHISTLSIAGFKGKNTLNKTFNENTLYINQVFNNNPYLISKFNGEIHILSAIEDKKLNAKIFRLGNIMPRQSDGKFQKNYNQNIFISALNEIINYRNISSNMSNIKIEFSPVDKCAEAIVKLLNSEKNTVYHIINNNEISIENCINYLEKIIGKFKIISSSEFISYIENNTDEYVKEYILNNNLNKYSENITLNELKKYNFIWSKTDENYIKYILKIIGKE